MLEDKKRRPPPFKLMVPWFATDLLLDLVCPLAGAHPHPHGATTTAPLRASGSPTVPPSVLRVSLPAPGEGPGVGGAVESHRTSEVGRSPVTPEARHGPVAPGPVVGRGRAQVRRSPPVGRRAEGRPRPLPPTGKVPTQASRRLVCVAPAQPRRTGSHRNDRRGVRDSRCDTAPARPHKTGPHRNDRLGPRDSPCDAVPARPHRTGSHRGTGRNG